MKSLFKLFGLISFIQKQPLNKGRRFKAIISFFRWQIAVRLINKSIIIPWVNDSKLVVGIGQTGLTGNIYSGFMEFEDMMFLIHALQPSEIFVDVGANAGVYTVLASKVVQSRSIAFEPISETADMLRDQLKINDIDSFVTIKNMGVGDKEGTLSFTNGKGAMNRVSLIDEVEDITSVKVTTLDAELSENAKYFLKIDVEGYEYNVIEGASELLTKDNVSAIIIESNGSGSKYGYTDMDVHKMLLGYGFIAILYDPFTRKVAQVDDDKIPSIGNTIYIKDIFMIAERCRVAPVCMVHTAGGLKI